jgi:Ser/Thr protein kinase RdoA (MazF antagonist)
LPGFHITPQYFQQYQVAINQALSVEDDPEFRFCRDFIASQADKLSILEDAKQRGELVERVIHGDPKLNNFLFQPDSQTIISLIDLDTVKPGLVHYDIGDCLRSCCHLTDSNQFDLARCEIILNSYLQEAGGFFSAADYDYLYAAIWLIPFELGLRFFSDYLQGNRYFKIQHPQHNLQRAKAQFELCADIERQQLQIKTLISALMPRAIANPS